MSNLDPVEKMMMDAIQDLHMPGLVIAQLADTFAADARYSVHVADQKSTLGRTNC
jgi:hypothetical protein